MTLVSMMLVFMRHVSMILDSDACLYDAPMYDAYIYDPRSLTLMSASMMRYFSVTDGPMDRPTDKQGDFRSWKVDHINVNERWIV